MSDITAYVNWLESQPEGKLRIAREIIKQRKKVGRGFGPEIAHETGMIAGMRLALSYLSDRPGDISDTGAEGYVSNVESADGHAAEQERGEMRS